MAYSVLDTVQGTRTATRPYLLVEEAMVQRVGLTAAAVYGLIRAYCGMRYGCCYASHEAIGRRLGLSRATVGRAIRALLDAGFIVDTTPWLRRKTHIYVTRDLVIKLPKRNIENDSPKLAQ